VAEDGKISAEELMTVFRLLGRTMTQPQALALIHNATNGTGSAITFVDFRKVMMADESIFQDIT